ncbi:TIGR04255 family protein [Sorangium sp. So ce119]|uniref:TIGR04255 family protein n=1 Tax=Sorangium sp. So ce119 TaxID=3133279 RepID=UPI003F633134
MPFPESKRVLYGKNPLEEVVCQLRFPPILRIVAEPPAAFQDSVRVTFPLYRRVVAQPPLGLQLPPEIMQAISAGGGVTHEFSSADQSWTLSLAQDFIALTTKAYRQWSDFKEKLRTPLSALRDVYAPAFFSRVGLRYRDRIDREAFGLVGVEWRELLTSEALGELADASIGPNVEHVLRELIVRLTEESGRVRIVHGLDHDGVKPTYIIDSDFFSEKQTETGVVDNVLDEFNRRAGHLFRWYITQHLHSAMEPRDPDAD